MSGTAALHIICNQASKMCTRKLAKNQVGVKSQKISVFIILSCWIRWDVPVGVPLDHSTPKGMSCIGTNGENCKSDNVSKYRFLLVAFLLLWHEN